MHLSRLHIDLTWRTLLLAGGFVALYAALRAHHDLFLIAGAWLSDRVGLAGVFAFVYLVDTFIVPATLDIVFPLTVGWPATPLLITVCAATVGGGISGYGIGRLLAHTRWVQERTAPFRDRGGDALIARWGLWAVVAAALTPLPFSTVSWIVGALRLDARRYALAALTRIPRVLAAYWLISGAL